MYFNQKIITVLLFGDVLQKLRETIAYISSQRLFLLQ